MRARRPDREGAIERDGVQVAFEIYGRGEPALLLVPASPITHARSWKGIAPSLARRFTVLTTDGRGTGRSDRPHARGCYAPYEATADLLAVLATAEIDRAVVVAHCHAVPWALRLAAEHPERVAGVVAIAPNVALAPPHAYCLEPDQRRADPVDTPTSWSMRNREFWRQDRGYRSWVEFFLDQQLPEPHSTKQYEDTVAWALDTENEAMIAEREGRAAPSLSEVERICRRLRCPVLVIHGSDDRCQPVARGEPGSSPNSPKRSRERPCIPRPGLAAWPGRSGPCTCPPRSGSATPAVTWPWPRN